MYWLQPPPYARWAAAALLLLGALIWDLRGSPSEPFPVAARAIPAGTILSDGDVTWHRLPTVLAPAPDLGGAVTAVDLQSGEPITRAVLAAAVGIPEDWWAIPVELGAHAVPGERVLLMVLDPPITVPGIVISPQQGDRWSMNHRAAVVAVPGESAMLVAAAESAGMLVAATRP